MAGHLYHVGATTLCPHGGMVTTVPILPRVFVSGQPVATVGDSFPALGCPLATSSTEFCAQTTWPQPATRVFASGKAVILNQGTAQCKSLSSLVMGPPTVVATQLRVKGT